VEHCSHWEKQLTLLDVDALSVFGSRGQQINVWRQTNAGIPHDVNDGGNRGTSVA